MILDGSFLSTARWRQSLGLLWLSTATPAGLNGVDVTQFTFVPGSDTAHSDRGLPTTPAAPRFIGAQTHTGRVAFRHIQIKAL